YLKEHIGVVTYRPLRNGCELQIENEDVAKDIFAELKSKQFIKKFELEEPTLNDIFIEKVGAEYELVFSCFRPYILDAFKVKSVYYNDNYYACICYRCSKYRFNY